MKQLRSVAAAAATTAFFALHHASAAPGSGSGPAAQDSKPTRIVDSPCAGCRAVIPKTTSASAGKLPLLVVLHGDWGMGPAELLSAWEKHALKRDVAVLSLQCPKDLGCKGSWWRWYGDPSWITSQVDAFASKHSVAIDRERMYLAGWSGGATYIGMRARTLQRTFAALIFHGGGHPGEACVKGDGSGGPVAFLVGNGNPLHSLAVQLREHHEACKDEVLWKMIPKADHPQEWSALDSNGGMLMEWMLGKKLVKPT